ncbi:MAG: RHS repeat-associated core domain-containing protein [Candidatus Gracilibacteria bacterium]|jgi:RHS repeat-associated protein
MLKKILTASVVFVVFLNSVSVSFASDVQRPPALGEENFVDTVENIVPAPLDIPEDLISPETTPSVSEDILDTIQTTPQLKDLTPPEQNVDSKDILDSDIPSVDTPSTEIVPSEKTQVDAILKNIEDRKPVGSNVKLQAEDGTGSSSINYPFKVAPGRNGLQPDLAINYNSQNRDDGNIFGYGWSLNTPYIERVNKKGTDKLYSENFFSSSMDGELSVVSLADSTHGIYGAKVENGGFLKYEYKTSGSWEASDKNGLIYKFGLTTNSRQDNTDNGFEVYKWMLEEIRDPNDNYIKYEYFKDAGQIYPLSIKYTGNGTTDGLLGIEFSRNGRSDPNFSYKARFKVKTNYLISNISESYGDGSTRNYALNYGIGDNGKRSILTSVVESGVQGGQTYTLPPDKFEYKKHEGSWYHKSSYTIPIDLWNGSEGEKSGVQVFDVNGDSLSDIVFSKSGESTAVYINSADGNGWQLNPSCSAVPVPFTNKWGEDRGVRIADVNGDGFADLLRAEHGAPKRVYINKWNGSDCGWQMDSNYSIPTDFVGLNNEDLGLRIADVNGDSLPDILRSTKSFNGVYFNKGDGTGWSNPSNLGIPLKFTDPGSAIADINNDGLADILFSQKGKSPVTWINNGYGWGWASNTDYYIPVYFADEKGGDNGVRINDVNGDSLPDLLYARDNDFANRKVYINRGNGTGWDASLKYKIPIPFLLGNSTTDNGVRLADVDGDGITDFMYRNDYGGMSSYPFDVSNRVYLGIGAVPELLDRFYNQKGGHSQIDYKSSAMYKDNSGKLLNPKLPFALSLVSGIWADDGIFFPSSTTYEYSGGEYYYSNALNRKFSGFSKITQLNKLSVDSSAYVTKTYYHQGNSTDTANGEYNDSEAKIGKIYSIEKYNENNSLYSKTFNFFETISLSGGRNFVTLMQKVDVAYDGYPSGIAKAETYYHDYTNGNLIKQTSMGEVQASSQGYITSDVGNDLFITEITYTKDPVKTISLKAVETTTDQSWKMVKQTQNFYDGLPSLSATKGNLTKQNFWISGTKYSSITKTYNNYGLVTQETDPNGNITTYTYDSWNFYPSTITNALGRSESYTYDYSSGQVKQYTEFNWKKFEMTYDVFDRPIEKRQPDPDSNKLIISTVYLYDDVSFPSSILQWNKTNSAGNGPHTYTYFDGLDRVIQTRSEIEDNVFSVKDYEYNKLGLLGKESLPYFSNGAGKTNSSTNNNLYISYTYDPLSRVKSVQNSVGTLTYVYDKWKTTIKDAENNSKDFFRDAYGNLIKVIEYNEGASYKTEYQYNGLGGLVKLTDSLGNVQNFTYDGLGRRTVAQDLHSPTDITFMSTNYTYDNAGNLISEIKQDGQTITAYKINYSYDKINRLISEDYTGQTGVETTYVYDNCAIGVGRLCSATVSKDIISNNSIVTEYSYDNLGNVWGESRTINGNKYNTITNYDWQGNPLLILYHDGAAAIYGYNKVGKVKTIKTLSTKIQESYVVKNISYIATGAVEKIEHANGTIEKNTFDANKLYRLTSKTTTLGAGQIQGLSYTYDKVGNVLQIVDSSNSTISKTANYQYDNLYRLKSVVVTKAGNGQNYEQKFQYDALGNILSKTGQGAYVYAGNQGNSYATPHAVTSVGSTNFGYDKSGNLSSDGKIIYTWDHKDRLILAIGAPAESDTRYSYDHAGTRIQKREGKDLTTYVNKFYEIRQDATVKHFYLGDDNVASIEVGQVDESNILDPIVYEDAEDGKISGWVAYSPTTSSISSTDEDGTHGKVITFKDTRNYGGFKLLKDDGTTWENTTHKFFNFDFSSKDNIQIALIVETSQGPKYLEYNSIVAESMAQDNYVYIKIDQSMLDGNWHTMTRDLQADIDSVASGTTLNKINYLQIWWMGSGYNDNIKVDNIKLMSSLDSTPVPDPKPVTIDKTIYHHSDHLSGANIDTDETGAVIEMTDYYPFGEVRIDQTTTAYKNPYKFTGKELDTSSGLYYYGARYYNPTIGRFVSRDPWGGKLDDPQSLNKYSYVRNNPLKYVDPTGEMFFLSPTSLLDGNVFDEGCVLEPPDTSSDYSSSGVIDESGNPVFDASAFTDTDDIIEAGIMFSLGASIAGKILSIKKTIAGIASTTTTSRPEGVPKNWVEKSSKKGEGTVYQDPDNPHNSVRVMPGNPKSPNSAQQKPYVVQMKDGKAVDIEGNFVNADTAEAHIPQKDFKFKP